VAIKVGALPALVKGWKCATAKNTPAVAKGLLGRFTDLKFIHMLHFLLNS
jgi:hypothetical protein